MKTIWNLISIISFGFFVFQVFFQESNTTIVEIPPIEHPENRPLLYVTDEMPRFPGCENSDLSKYERQSCANEKLLEFIYSNLEYPSDCSSVEGTSVAQFTIRKDGSLADIKIRKSLSTRFDNEIVKLLKKMPQWIPGKQDGKAVNIRFTLPVKIRLE